MQPWAMNHAKLVQTSSGLAYATGHHWDHLIGFIFFGTILFFRFCSLEHLRFKPSLDLQMQVNHGPNR